MTILYTRSSISAEAALRAVQVAQDRAREANLPVAVAVAGVDGGVVAFVRMDGTSELYSQVAQDKAYTAATTGMATRDWGQLLVGDPMLAAAPAEVRRLVTIAGGVPIVVDGLPIGGIGVSGGHYTQDAEIAETAASSLNVNV